MKFTHCIARLFVMAVMAVATVSCITENTVPNNVREKVSLEAWMKLNKPELLANYQEEGGYYVEILDGDKRYEDESLAHQETENDFGSKALMDQDTCWVFTNMTGRDINGRICSTRNGNLAEMCGTFSYFTHYVPYINYCGNINLGLLEGSYLSMRNELKVGNELYRMRVGSKVRLYLPSSVAYGGSGSSAQGGYEGQYSLDASRPLILDIEVLKAIKNPSERELEMVMSFRSYEKKWVQATKQESEKSDEEDDLTLKGLYYTHDYNPTKDNLHKNYLRPEMEGSTNKYVDAKKYADMERLNKEIDEILLKRFGEGVKIDPQHPEKTEVTQGGRANVWYVVRFLDGFVVDTNIAEIRTLIFDEKSPSCEVFSYSPSDDEGKEAEQRTAIGAWYYCIPKMHYGAYGQILTTSGYAYGAAGLTGTTTSETTSTGSSSYYNAMNYYNYYNSYYNYYNPYYNYYDYNYYNYNYDYGYGGGAGETTTTITISTEILPYTPLVFTIYVEPNK